VTRVLVQAIDPVTFGFPVLSLVVSTIGVWLAIRIAERAGVMDVPNERSSHSRPTPRMGGVPMVGAAILAIGGWVLFTAGGKLPWKGLPHALLFALAMSILGFVDDVRDLSPLVRFLFQAASATFALWTLVPPIPALFLGGWVISNVVWIPVGVLFAVWMLNLYNFMDGIDGLAGGEAALASSFFFVVFAWYGEPGWAVANLVVAASSMGFLVHNWPPARIFMGDAGSAFLGAFYGMQSVVAALSTAVPFLVLVLPFANFILDTTFTLIRRILTGEKWYQAHRSHFYQRMVGLGMSHGKVTSIELLVAAVSCAAAAGCIGADVRTRVALVAAVVVVISGAGCWVVRKDSLH